MWNQQQARGPRSLGALARFAASISLLFLGPISCGNGDPSSSVDSSPETEVGSVSQDLTSFSFPMIRSAVAEATGPGCLRGARATVNIKTLGPVEVMDVDATGLPPNTEFDLFVIQVPSAPFGLSWYQGDLESNGEGHAHQQFIGRFSRETFIVAPGIASAPVIHHAPFPDASANPKTDPVHTFHLGLWFNSPADAVAAGCPGTTTPFNGDHNAGVQALSTRTFGNLEGPLRNIQ